MSEMDWRNEYKRDGESEPSKPEGGESEPKAAAPGRYYLPPEDAASESERGAEREHAGEEPVLEPERPSGGYYTGHIPYASSAPERPESSSGYGIASLILGILSLCCCGLPCGIAAIVTALIDRSRRGLFTASAVAGLIMGILGLISWLMGVVLFIVILIPALGEIESDPEFTAALMRFFL